MNELGPDAESFHREAGAWAREIGVELLVGVGKLALAYGPDRHAADAESAAGIVEELLEPGDTVLVKGSRTVGLEAVTERLRAARPLAGGDRR
jgi:UDP-N-acetylmuramoyl-tripeptide--D-alanyl-D-alanine ligase